ncbi:MAG: hypothetical protein CBB68_15270 [Rhodospirillaceae bacterium TMED8]|nr:RNA-binding protein S4 [Magnetovibrio sp.]OUT47786.1 MAG: hypothetical protein CBB68_15270 [Rhodospirillaceae bacterium TMED8]
MALDPLSNLPSLRLDKWLWHARFFKSRSLATQFCSAGKLRVNGIIIKKAHHELKTGEVLTFAKGRRVFVVKVLGLGTRRGPATEAYSLYTDLSPPPLPDKNSLLPTVLAPRREPGSGRPTKRERRQTDKLREPSSIKTFY